MKGRYAVAAGTGAAALVLGACGGGGADEASATSFDIAVSNATEPYSIPWLVGKDQGFFEKRGVRIGDIVPGKGGGTTIRNMLSGDLPIADVGFTSVLESGEAGMPLTVVGGATHDVAVVPPSVVAKTDRFRVVVSSADHLKKFQQSVITTTPEFAERNPDTVKAVVDKAITYDNWSAGFDAEAIEQAVKAQRIAMDGKELEYRNLFRTEYLPQDVSSTLPAECE
ncbi:ABC transporter substrate-binding protein [Streptomyces sp. NPDC004135]